MSQNQSLGFSRLLLSLALTCLLLILLTGCFTTLSSANAASKRNTSTKTWSVNQNGTILQIGYGSGTSFPQYGALDLSSSYFRLVYSTTANWGTSLILLPVFWSQTSCPPPGLCQGAPITAPWQIVGTNLVLSVKGTIGGLNVSSTVNLMPPANNAIIAQISTTVTGHVVLDKRPGEAFKPVMLSSMHISSTRWDTQAAFIGTQTFALPQNGWIIQPPIVAQNFGLQGGTSAWKTNAPTLEVTLNQGRQITGWVTPSIDPNNDNVGYWCATSKVLPSWSFSVKAEAGQNLLFSPSAV